MNRCFSGFNPWSYHLTNVILHSVATWLFVRVARVVFNLTDRTIFHHHFQSPEEDGNSGGHCWTTNQNMALLVAALLFASHPIHTEAVAGVVGRADVAATALALSSFLAYTSHVKSRNRHKNIIPVNSSTTTFCQCDLGSGAKNGFAHGNNGTMKQPSLKSLDSGSSSSSYVISPMNSSSLLNFPTMAYLVIAILLAGIAMLCKEHGIMVLFICVIYDIIISLIRYRRSQV